MNVKALASVVGTLSLSVLATGCVSTKSAHLVPEKQDAAASGAPAAAEQQELQQAEGRKAASSEESGAQGGCKVQHACSQ
ncbi:hypothetical protein P2318_11800 [Myxococcaceae bacterium GXIMD 01537]